jgi:hypothetical protein
MVDRIVKISDNKFVVIYDNRLPLNVESSHGEALHIIERLLSPRHDMTYSDYLLAYDQEDEITEIIEVA